MGDNVVSETRKEGKPQLMNVEYGSPVVHQKTEGVWVDIGVALALGILMAAIQFVAMMALPLDLVWSMILAVGLVMVYAIALFFLLESKLFREVQHPIIQTIENPVYIEKIVEKEVNTGKPIEVIKEVEKPVYIDRRVEVEHPVYYQEPVFIVKKCPKPRKKKALHIPHYDYVGSSLTKVYHHSSCRLSKSIKRKYRVHGPTMEFYKKKGYKPCEVCVLKIKKV